MDRMLLVQEKKKIEISHFYYLVSSYEQTENGEMGNIELRNAIKDALIKARETVQTQIVEFDRVDFCFHVFPGGQISLMAAIHEFDSAEF